MTADVVICYHAGGREALPHCVAALADNAEDIGTIWCIKDGQWKEGEVAALRPLFDGLQVEFRDHPKYPHGVAVTFNMAYDLSEADYLFQIGCKAITAPGAIMDHLDVATPGAYTHSREVLCSAWPKVLLTDPSTPVTKDRARILSSPFPYWLSNNGSVLIHRPFAQKVRYDESYAERGYGCEDYAFAYRWYRSGGRFGYVDAAVVGYPQETRTPADCSTISNLQALIRLLLPAVRGQVAFGVVSELPEGFMNLGTTRGGAFHFNSSLESLLPAIPEQSITTAIFGSRIPPSLAPEIKTKLAPGAYVTYLP